MSEEMANEAIECATYALNEFNVESVMANYIKKEFDKKYKYCTAAHTCSHVCACCLPPASRAGLGRSLPIWLIAS